MDEKLMITIQAAMLLSLYKNVIGLFNWYDIPFSILHIFPKHLAGKIADYNDNDAHNKFKFSWIPMFAYPKSMPNRK